MLRLGYKASAEQFGPRELLDFAVTAEDNGFESVFVSDHLQPWRHSDGHAPFAIAWLAATGERTKKVLLGTSVATPTFRYHPAIVAQAFGTLGVLLPNRIILGVGTGEHLNEGALASRGRTTRSGSPACVRRSSSSACSGRSNPSLSTASTTTLETRRSTIAQSSLFRSM